MGRKKKETIVENTQPIEAKLMYVITYHYMHFHPDEVVKMDVPGCLVGEAIRTIQSNPNVLVDLIEKKSA